MSLCRPARLQGSQSTSRNSRIRGWSFRGTCSRSAISPTASPPAPIQFDAERAVSFFNQPFAVMAQLDPEWLAEGPEFDRVLERMRERNRLPEVARLPGLEGGAAGMVHQRE